MKIVHKVTLLVLAGAVSLVLLSVLSAAFRDRELSYFHLVDAVEGVRAGVLSARLAQEAYLRTGDGADAVFKALDTAVARLENVDSALYVGTSKTDGIQEALSAFRTTFKDVAESDLEVRRIVGGITRRQSILAKVRDEMDVKIQIQIGHGFLYENYDIAALQELRSASLTAFAHVNRIVALIDRGLLIERDINGFQRIYLGEIKGMAAQVDNLTSQAETFADTYYLNAARDVALIQN